ncbi:Hypothetical predicted protein [Cloeon dipterum]|uniref:VWFA domain-containing protein n=1 Tax=Cloeon dipterum TaxID=197152 RepID=A0A8S1DBH2_9INSE|nr:Hypothetical predicted protein [Cloeon dipterum]
MVRYALAAGTAVSLVRTGSQSRRDPGALRSSPIVRRGKFRVCRGCETVWGHKHPGGLFFRLFCDPAIAMEWWCVIGALLLVQATTLTAQSAVTLNKSGYDGLVISIGENVPHAECSSIVENLKTMMTDASRDLNNALKGRAFFRSASVLFPSSWPDDCGQHVEPASGEMTTRADVRIMPQHLIFGENLWTQQSQGCGKPGDFISIPYTKLTYPANLGRAFVKEWAKLRYGVFDESGIEGDVVYPLCYFDERDGAARVSGCSDKYVNTDGICSGQNVTAYSLKSTTDGLTRLLVPQDATSSIMFAHTSPDVTNFCNHNNHNRYAPTKQNAMCDRLSVMEVILEHKDLKNIPIGEEPYFGDTTPVLKFKREKLTRYVFVIEDTNNMASRESWNFLRDAIKMVVLDLSETTEVGIVTVVGTHKNNTKSTIQLRPLVPLNTWENRQKVSSVLPFSPGDGAEQHNGEQGSSCLDCGVSVAIDMLTKHGKQGGNSVIVLVAPGTDRVNELKNLGNVAKSQSIRIATVTYPQIARSTYSSLDSLAHATGAPAFTVMEKRQNHEKSFFDSYFELTQAFLAITNEFYQGDRSKLRVQIHRKKVAENSARQETGTFFVPQGLGEPSQVLVYIHNPQNTLLKTVTLKSPSHRIYNQRSEELLHLRVFENNAVLNESGTWTYTFDQHPGSNQPHFIVVSATPKSSDQWEAPVVARFFTSSLELDEQSDPLVLYAEVKQGDWPVMAANVVVTVTMLHNNTNSFEKRITLLDTGSGDPDITQNDGIYSRYFTPDEKSSAGTYRFELSVNGHQAYTWQTNYPNSRTIANYDDSSLQQMPKSQCCGSTIWSSATQVLSPFQITLPPVDIKMTNYTLSKLQKLRPSRIGNLKVLESGEREPSLVWTAPGSNGDVGTVERYDLRYAFDLVSLMDNFDACYKWPHTLDIPLEAGTETTFRLDFNKLPELLDRPIFVALRGINVNEMGGKVSNVVRLLEMSPPTPPVIPSNLDHFPADPKVVPNLSSAGGLNYNSQVIVAVTTSLIILVILVTVGCVLFMHRKKNTKEALPPALSSGGQQPYSGPPPRYEAEDDYNKQRDKAIYATALPEHHQVHLQQQNNVPHQQIMNARTLSPYQSWTASQLLHEHERRHSPYGYLQQDGPPVPPPPHDQSIYTVNYYNNSFMSIADEGNSIYGQRPKQGPPTLPKPNFNPSLQGSLSSVNSAEKKKRNVTMV